MLHNEARGVSPLELTSTDVRALLRKHGAILPSSGTEVGRSGKKTKSTVPATEVAAASECPRGGDHEWTEVDGERFCSKCSEPAPAKGKGKKAKRGDSSKEKKLSALDAAAKVLAEAAEPMNAKDMIDAMAAKGYWTSPGGKTPHATRFGAVFFHGEARIHAPVL